MFNTLCFKERYRNLSLMSRKISKKQINLEELCNLFIKLTQISTKEKKNGKIEKFKRLLRSYFYSTLYNSRYISFYSR